MYFDTIFTNFKCKCTYTSLKTTKVNCNEISHIYGWSGGGGGGRGSSFYVYENF